MPNIARIITALTAVLCTGCFSMPDIEAPAHMQVSVGMTLAEVQKKLGEGEVRNAAQLPVSPKPWQLYAKLPRETEYRLWTPVRNKKKQADILLGTLDGKVIYKQVIHSTGGKIKSDTFAAPEYQNSP